MEHTLLIAWHSLLCGAGKKLKQSKDLSAVKYMIILKSRKYPIDNEVLLDAEVCV